ncbi:MAG: DNA polymerase IV [Bacillota bacterium]
METLDNKSRDILHCDLNNFYASVECKLFPELADKYVAVCGNPDARHGIVLAKNEKAKKCGVATGDVMWEAVKKCPELICVPTHFDEYGKYSKLVRDVYYRFTDQVEPYGLDECWLDVTASKKLHGSPREIADKIRNIVKDEIGLTISVGVSFTKTLAKLGSDLKKPNATTVLSQNNFKHVAWDLPCGEFFMCGKRTTEKLRKMNIFTIGNIASAPDHILKKTLGINGLKLKREANGISDEVVNFAENIPPPQSVGHGVTTNRDLNCEEEAIALIFALSAHVASRLRRYDLCGKKVSVSVKNNRLESVTRQTLMPFYSANENEIATECVKLYKSFYDIENSLPIRAISIGVASLLPIDVLAQDSTERNACEDKILNLDKKIDGIRDRYGFDSLVKASSLDSAFNLSGKTSDDKILPFKRR